MRTTGPALSVDGRDIRAGHSSRERPCLVGEATLFVGAFLLMIGERVFSSVWLSEGVFSVHYWRGAAPLADECRPFRAWISGGRACSFERSVASVCCRGRRDSSFVEGACLPVRYGMQGQSRLLDLEGVAWNAARCFGRVPRGTEVGRSSIRHAVRLPWSAWPGRIDVPFQYLTNFRVVGIPSRVMVTR